MTPEAVIANRIPNAGGFKRAMAAYLREDAKHAAGRSDSIQTRQHARLLELTAALLESLDDDDHAVGALFDAQVSTHASSRGEFQRGEYHPGRRAGNVIGSAGFTPATPSPDELLAEIVRASQADLIAAMNERVQHAASEAEQAFRGTVESKPSKRSCAPRVSSAKLRRTPLGSRPTMPSFERAEAPSPFRSGGQRKPRCSTG